MSTNRPLKNPTQHLQLVTEEMVTSIAERPIDEAQKGLIQMLDAAYASYNEFYYENPFLKMVEASVRYFTKTRHEVIAETKTKIQTAVSPIALLEVVSQFFQDGGFEATSVNSYFLDQFIEKIGGYKPIKEDEIAGVSELKKVTDRDTVRVSARKIVADAFVRQVNKYITACLNEQALIEKKKYKPNISPQRLTLSKEFEASMTSLYHKTDEEPAAPLPPLPRAPAPQLNEVQYGGVRRALTELYSTASEVIRVCHQAPLAPKPPVAVGKIQDRYADAITTLEKKFAMKQ